MRTDAEFECFLKKWRDAFRAPSPVWDGNRAVAELKRAGSTNAGASERISVLSFVQCDPVHRWHPKEMLKKVFAEVKDYKKQNLQQRKEFQKIELFLAGMQRRAIRKSSSVKHSLLKRLLENTADAIDRRRIAARDFGSRAKRSPLAPWEGLWPEHPRIERITRGIDLDTRLQVQAAKMFRTFMHKDEGVSLRTIARLVVLVYFVAGLASERNGKRDQDGRLRIAKSSRAISWRTVEDTLRRNRIR